MGTKILPKMIGALAVLLKSSKGIGLAKNKFFVSEWFDGCLRCFKRWHENMIGYGSAMLGICSHR